MNNFTTDTYEMKREILNFSQKISKGVNKSTIKFVMDMEYGIAKSGSSLISNIARSLDEKIKLNNTIERLCDNLNNLKEEEKEKIWNNYLEEVKKITSEETPVVLFDDSDINKEYSRKLEDLDRVIDASSIDRKTVNGYHICEAVVLTNKEKQPISIYSEIYSCKSYEFESKNKYTMESIKESERLYGENFIGVFDRGYDDNKIYEYMSRKNHKFVNRLREERVLLFKGKRRKVEEVARERKGKITMDLLFDYNEKKKVMVSYTKVKLPSNKREYQLVIVYGLKEEKPMKILTNIEIKNKEDVEKIVRLYFSRWRIEEYFRGKKQEYDFENMRVRTIKSMNNLNMMITIHLGHIGMIAEKIDKKLLSIKIICSSKSLRNKIVVWISQMARGIKEILKQAREGIKQWQKIEKQEKYKQLELRL